MQSNRHFVDVTKENVLLTSQYCRVKRDVRCSKFMFVSKMVMSILAFGLAASGVCVCHIFGIDKIKTRCIPQVNASKM